MTRLLTSMLLAIAAVAHAAPPRTIVFLTDFGTADDSVAICKGVMQGIAPAARIVDLTHAVTPYQIADGARFLAGAAPYYSAGTVFVGVVDPGVGTSRRAVVIHTRRDQWFVVPDNGLASVATARDGVESARAIANPAWQREHRGFATFHGRDVFSPVAAHLARGDDWRAVGPVITDLVALDLPRVAVDGGGLHGSVIATDGPYGNLVTNVSAEDLQSLGWALRDVIPVEVGGRTVSAPLMATFGDVPKGSPLVYVDSRGRMAMAVNLGDFAATYGVTPPAPLRIPRKPPQ